MASGVPDVQLNCFTIQIYGSDLEIYSEGTDIAFSVSVISESQKKTICDCSKPILASGVSDLQLNCFTVQLYGSDLEIHSNGTDIAFSVSVISKSQ